MKPLEPPNESMEQIKRLLRKPLFWVIVVAIILMSLISEQGGDSALRGAGYLLIGAIVYFLPSIAARKKPNETTVFVINLFLGWTVIGWVVALAMAVNNPQPAVVQYMQPAAAQPALTGRACPYCAEQIQPAAIVCKHCGRDLPAT